MADFKSESPADIKSESGADFLRNPHPTSVELSGAASAPERRFARTLELLREIARAGALLRELHRFGVDRTQLAKEHRGFLIGLREARRASTIRARYALGRATYECNRTSAVDGEGVVWLARTGAGEIALFEAVAGRLFRSSEEGLVVKLHSALSSFETHSRLPLWDELDPDGDGDAVSDDDEPLGGGRPVGVSMDEGRAALGHVPPRPVAPPLPKPTSFPPVRQADFEASGRAPAAPLRQMQRTPAPGSPGARRNTVLEEQEKAALKEAHYAFHCQACLGVGQPGAIAPPFTYVAHQDVRATLVHAHHVDHLQNRGALGAGNLLILCKFHHHFLGDKLDRQSMLTALRAASPERRDFPADTSGLRTKPLIGRLATVTIDVRPYDVRIFFTDEHTEAWLTRADPDTDAV